MATIFYRFSEFLNYDVLYLGKYSTDLNEIWHTYSCYKELCPVLEKSNMAAIFAIMMNF